MVRDTAPTCVEIEMDNSQDTKQKINFRLWQQIACLLVLPLVCQIFFVCMFVTSIDKLDRAGKLEAKSKQILSLCLETRSSLLQFSINHVNDLSSSAKDEAALSAHIDRSLNELKGLVSDNQQASHLVTQYINEITRVRATIGEGSASNLADSANYGVARVVVNQFVKGLRDGVLIEEQLYAIYQPVVSELQPRALEARERLMQLAMVSLVINSTLVAVLGMFFWRSTLKRLAGLMTSLDRFEEGKIDFQPIGGRDEIAELDSIFRETVTARYEAEELNKSLYAMVSHDLRSPLASVRMLMHVFLETQVDYLKDGDFVKLDRIDSEINRVVKIATTFLDLERIENGNLDLDLNWNAVSSIFSQAMIATESLSHARGITISENIIGEDICYCDSERTIQILVNLLSNAVKFSPDDSVIELVAKQDSDGSRVEVIDQGPGVPHETQSRLFQKFSQLEEEPQTKKSGAGLGLYICKMLVETHGGTIGYEAATDGGSRFWFKLPYTVDDNIEKNQN